MVGVVRLRCSTGSDFTPEFVSADAKPCRSIESRPVASILHPYGLVLPPRRRALLQKRAHPFLALWSAQCLGEGLRRIVEDIAERLLGAREQYRLGRSISPGRTGADKLKRLAYAFFETCVVLAKQMYEPDPLGFAAVEAHAGQSEPTRLRESDALHQERRDLCRRNPEPRFRQCEASVGVADRYVGDSNETQAAAVDGALDHRDDSLRHCVHARQE